MEDRFASGFFEPAKDKSQESALLSHEVGVGML